MRPPSLEDPTPRPTGGNPNSGGSSEPGFRAAYKRARSDPALRRDSDVMGITVSLTLLVALSAGSDTAPHTKADILLIIWGTTVGIAVAHWFALGVSTWLVPDSTTRRSPLELLIAQTTTAVLVASSATLPALMLTERFDRLGTRLIAAVSMGVLVAFETRRSRLPMARRLFMSATVILGGVTVATAKWFISQ